MPLLDGLVVSRSNIHGYGVVTTRPFKRGAIVGATDEIGATAVECVHPIRDLHVTLLHLLGLDDNRLTYFHAGRYKQLSQFGGEVITDLLA